LPSIWKDLRNAHGKRPKSASAKTGPLLLIAAAGHPVPAHQQLSADVRRFFRLSRTLITSRAYAAATGAVL
jgi:hypothetical protein